MTPAATVQTVNTKDKVLFSRLLDRIKVYYEMPENKARFEAWKKEKEASVCNSISK